jgi:hypothetical protein
MQKINKQTINQTNKRSKNKTKNKKTKTIITITTTIEDQHEKKNSKKKKVSKYTHLGFGNDLLRFVADIEFGHLDVGIIRGRQASQHFDKGGFPAAANGGNCKREKKLNTSHEKKNEKKNGARIVTRFVPT